MVSLAFSRFFQIVAFFKKHPKFDLSVYLGPISVPYMPQKKTPQQISSFFMDLCVKSRTAGNHSILTLSKNLPANRSTFLHKACLRFFNYSDTSLPSHSFLRIKGI
ncbi:hypothetical protein ACN88_00035 [Escherichia coli]|nr:hypothetical protein [Escherichia coli]OKU70235.1 hypothetical protein ACN88_00035 [Escherichia coli]OTB91745.1 hypothetical protein AW066_25305 [Escherichia coli]OTE49885.1 hypothetical protein AW115_16995 [Escherichia coli]PUQ95738.1 hypothetical protein DB282_20710 [Escherichia coli]